MKEDELGAVSPKCCHLALLPHWRSQTISVQLPESRSWVVLSVSASWSRSWCAKTAPIIKAVPVNRTPVNTNNAMARVAILNLCSFSFSHELGHYRAAPCAVYHRYGNSITQHRHRCIKCLSFYSLRSYHPPLLKKNIDW